jgi:CubicO group peptidase (beta-lactamase class C family)
VEEERVAAVKKVLVGLLVVVFVLVALLIGLLVFFNIPSNAAGMAAKAVCSAAFVAGREPDADALMAEDVLPASPALGVVSTTIDTEQLTATSKFLGIISRTASLTADRGCVLDLPADPGAQPYAPPPADPAAWPQGDGTSEAGDDNAELQQVIDAAFVGAGDVAAANPRAVAVVQDGELLALREGQGFANAALHGWSMTKTVGAMLAYDVFRRQGLDLQTPVVDAFALYPDRTPQWVAGWREDERRDITIADLVFMRAGLGFDEGYEPWSDTVQMLYGEGNMAQWAADHPADAQAGQEWEYLSGVSNILADVLRGQFPNDDAYWAQVRTRILDPLEADSATLETDTNGTQVASSYLWASAADWAKLGQLLLDDGRWQGQQVLAPGFLELAGQQAVQDGEGAGYSAQAWLPGNPVGGECRDVDGVPPDVVSMEGHWGQIVAAVPSRDVVIVRLGWTFTSGAFDSCGLIRDVLAALPQS